MLNSEEQINDASLEQLCQSLRMDPTNLTLADRYWNALGRYKGQDIRSGRYVIEVYRNAALTSREGIEALARAYKELFELSGESPRIVFFDKDLIYALQEYLRNKNQKEEAGVQWILESIEID